MRRQITESRVDQFFKRSTVVSAPTPTPLPLGLVAPLYQIVRAVDNQGDFNPEARVTWESSVYTDGFFDANQVVAGIPGLMRGAEVDPAWVNPYLVIGAPPNGTVARLKGTDDEEVRYTGSAVLGVNGGVSAGERKLTIDGLNMNLLFADVTWFSPPINYLEDVVVYVEVEGFPKKPLLVHGVLAFDNSSLTLRNDLNIPAGTYNVAITLFPNQFEVLVGPQAASTPVAGFTKSVGSFTHRITSNGVRMSSSGGIVNLSESVMWTLIITERANASEELEVELTNQQITVKLAKDLSNSLDHTVTNSTLITYDTLNPTSFSGSLNDSLTIGVFEIYDSTPQLVFQALDNSGRLTPVLPTALGSGIVNFQTGEITLDIPAGEAIADGPLTLSYRDTKNSITEINAKIAEAIEAVEPGRVSTLSLETSDSSGWVGYGSSDGLTPPTLVGPSTVAWSGVIEATTKGIAGNDITVSVQVASGPDAPTTARHVGNTILITLGTSAGVVDPTKCLIEGVGGINSLLQLADDVVRITIPAASGSEVLSPYTLGFVHNHAGYETINYGSTLEDLRGGVSSGGVKIYGGLLPLYSGEEVSAEVYLDYRALRLDMSPRASINSTGNRPEFVDVQVETLELLLGEVSVANPLALATHQFLLTSNKRSVRVMSVDEVTSENPWGTREATERVMHMARVRGVYHLAILNDAPWVPELTTSFANSLGGTEYVALRTPMRLYIPTKNLETAQDLPIASGNNANKSNFNDTTVSASLDFESSGVLVGDIIIFQGLEYEPTAPVELQLGLRGFEISALNVGGSPFTVTTSTDLPATAVDRAVTIYRRGKSLYDSRGNYLTQEGANALYDWHNLASNKHARLNKHHVERYEVTVDGILQMVDGVYGLGQYMGIIADSPYYLPVSQQRYNSVSAVYGTNDTYSSEQLDQLTAAGLVLPVKPSSNSRGIAYVRRDVSSETNDPNQPYVIRRRTAGVTEDFIALKMERMLRGLLGASLLGPQFLDTIARGLSGLVDSYRGSPALDWIRVEGIDIIDEHIRKVYDINDTGVLISLKLKHRDEASRAIVLNKIIAPS